ncbi:phosphotransferase [Paenibacillus lutimineralis]|uniref:Aminoglycoside phosphotransferase n=1 Tax=Paenibacillus lutimineralis TaxID=2707005 RepID=A0A3Q9IB29_9BACL|nr:phosphotransferase [Paenibacillus lutimineralis]AZS15105.1 aminoglycoside phosphotransferase [Paenibacillus lutimineralis]
MGLLLGSKVGEGACSEVFEWEDSSKIIKIAKENTDYKAMAREYNNNLLAWENGLSVARPYELTEYDGRTGIVFERIYGQTIMERFLRRAIIKNIPAADIDEEDIRTTAALLYQIHNSNIEVPSSQMGNMEYSIRVADYLSIAEKEEIISTLRNLPKKQLPCHGDPNPNNILVKEDGNAVFIDWMSASMGNPEADLAEYIIIMRYAVLPSQYPQVIVQLFDSIRETIINIFMDEYNKLSGITYDEVAPWIIPVAARKLSVDGIGEEEKKLLVQEIRRNLNILK